MHACKQIHVYKYPKVTKETGLLRVMAKHKTKYIYLLYPIDTPTAVGLYIQLIDQNMRSLPKGVQINPKDGGLPHNLIVHKFHGLIYTLCHLGQHKTCSYINIFILKCPELFRVLHIHSMFSCILVQAERSSTSCVSWTKALGNKCYENK